MAKVKYKEGQIYEFKFVKKVFIDDEYLVFEDKYNERYVVLSMHYRHYNLNPNQLIKCLITRIDCSGKLSFEPEHPYYSIGGSYDFDFVRMHITADNEYDPNSGRAVKTKDYVIIVADKDSNEHRVIPKSWQKKKNYKTDRIKCRLVKIVKGHFQLVNLEEEKPMMRRIWDNISGKEK